MGNKDNKTAKATRKRRFRGNQCTSCSSSAEIERPTEQSLVISTPPSQVVRLEEGPRTSTPDNTQLSNASATAKKLRYDATVSDTGNQETRYEHSMIMYMSVLHNLIKLVGKCPECSSSILVANDLKAKKGFAYLLRINCSQCSWEHSTYTSSKILDTDRAGPKTFEVNTRMVLAFREIGKGRTALETFSQCLNMPNCITQRPYDSIKKSLLRSFTEVCQASQAKAAQETKKEIGSFGIDDVVDCNVSVDGTWQKRGYSSLNGVVTLMSNILLG